MDTIEVRIDNITYDSDSQYSREKVESYIPDAVDATGGKLVDVSVVPRDDTTATVFFEVQPEIRRDTIPVSEINSTARDILEAFDECSLGLDLDVEANMDPENILIDS